MIKHIKKANKKIGNNIKNGVKTNQIAVTTFITSCFAYGLAYIDPKNPLSDLLIQNKEIIISILSSGVLCLITLGKK